MGGGAWGGEWEWSDENDGHTRDGHMLLLTAETTTDGKESARKGSKRKEIQSMEQTIEILHNE